MVSTEKYFHGLAQLYMALIYQTLLFHNVKEVRCGDEKQHFFDRIVVNDDERIEVYKYGLSKPSDSLHFDFTIDYAQCLANIEHDLFLAQRNGKPERGMIFKFNDNK